MILETDLDTEFSLQISMQTRQLFQVMCTASVGPVPILLFCGANGIIAVLNALWHSMLSCGKDWIFVMATRGLVRVTAPIRRLATSLYLWLHFKYLCVGDHTDRLLKELVAMNTTKDEIERSQIGWKSFASTWPNHREPKYSTRGGSKQGETRFYKR
jgi:hypothetical protein